MTTKIRFSDKPEQILPRFTKAGYEFQINNDIWILDQNRTINWNLINIDLNPMVYEGFKLSIARLAEEVSSHHTFNCFMYFKQYLLSSEIYKGGVITSNLILALKATLNKENEYKLGTIRALLRCWIEWNFNGLEKNLEHTLDRLVLSGNVKGKAVLHHCPYTGPYSLTEQQSLLVWAGNAFQKENLTLEEFCWFYSIYATARRPSQIRALRLCDLSIQSNGKEVIYEINIPRAKQRNGMFREEFRSLRITEDIYLVLKNLTEIVRKKALEHLKELKESELVQLPIFMNFSRFYDCKNIHGFKAILNQTPDFFHVSSADANYMSQVISRKCEAVSERTGDYIHFTPVRCRRTRATNLSRHGITGVQMAYLLDHSDTQQLKVYTAHTGELALRIFDKMNDAMTLLAMQFEGRITKNESEALRASDPSSRIFKSSGNQLGNCGGSPSCQAGMKACLLCNQFQPLAYAPWDELFLEFVEELEQRKREGASELVLKSYDLQVAHIKAIMDACDKYNQIESIT
ncbi:site-specific integrase [Acinetobacter parvus]|uniref:site-specific integrase n=1 Tax=Acinetobacter parvus TaxID=134533 RepID=UPI00391DA019